MVYIISHTIRGRDVCRGTKGKTSSQSVKLDLQWKWKIEQDKWRITKGYRFNEWHLTGLGHYVASHRITWHGMAWHSIACRTKQAINWHCDRRRIVFLYFFLPQKRLFAYERGRWPEIRTQVGQQSVVLCCSRCSLKIRWERCSMSHVSPGEKGYGIGRVSYCINWQELGSGLFENHQRWCWDGRECACIWSDSQSPNWVMGVEQLSKLKADDRGIGLLQWPLWAVRSGNPVFRGLGIVPTYSWPFFKN